MRIAERISVADDYEAAIGCIFAQFKDDYRAASGDQSATRCALKRANLATLAVYLIHADGPDVELDQMLAALLSEEVPVPTLPYTASLDAARSFVTDALPGFWVSSGLCALTGHCSLGPDYDGP